MKLISCLVAIENSVKKMNEVENKEGRITCSRSSGISNVF